MTGSLRHRRELPDLAPARRDRSPCANDFLVPLDIATLVAPLTLRSATPVRLHHQLPPPRRRTITTRSAAAGRPTKHNPHSPRAFPRFSSIRLQWCRALRLGICLSSRATPQNPPESRAVQAA